MAEPKALYLSEASLGQLLLDETRGYVVTELDLGWASVRENVEDRVNDSGTDDYTAFFGARAVTFNAACFDTDDGTVTRWQALEALRTYAQPWRRPVLVFNDSDGIVRRVRVRGADGSWPLRRAPDGVAVAMQTSWKAPDGILELLDLTTVTVPAVPPTEAGRTYPKTYPYSYPTLSVTGAVEALNAGRAPAVPSVQLWGPCTNPRLVNVTTGKQSALTGLTLAADQYADISVANRTILLNGRAAENLGRYRDFTRHSFWKLAGGSNLLRYVPDTYDAGARAVVAFRSAST